MGWVFTVHVKARMIVDHLHSLHLLVEVRTNKRRQLIFIKRRCLDFHSSESCLLLKMALVLGSNLAKGSIFELSDSESAFHPWWDSLQDYVMYTAIIVGTFFRCCKNAQLSFHFFLNKSNFFK